MKYFYCTHPAWLACALLLGCLTSNVAHADLRNTRVCSDAYEDLLVPLQLRQNGVCYSGFGCTLGMRGDWLDLTNEVLASAVGRHQVNADASLRSRGNGFVNSNECLAPPSKNNEAHLLVDLTNVRGSGLMRIKANRPGPLGLSVHSDQYDVQVRDGSRYLSPHVNRTQKTGVYNIVEFSGMGLMEVRLKARPLSVASSSNGSAPATTPRAASMASALRSPANAQQLSALQNTAAVRAMATTQASTAQASAPSSSPAPAPLPDITIIGKTQTLLRLQINFKEQGIYSLGDYLEFADGEPPINADMGWPTIDVRTY